ncbi:MAG TPA: PAS domain S-box protein [Thermodesulfobacteriota bacterium]|nr:PAS domain S-box protein [Thermodesulfobacteriota bacterium]
MKSKLKHHIVPEMGQKPAALDLIEPIKAVRDDASSTVPYNSEGAGGGDFFFGLLEESPDVFFTLTPEGTITYINPAIESLTGWERDMWIGRPFSDLLVNDTGDNTARNYLEFENGRQRRVFEAGIRLRGGGSVSTKVSVSLRTERGGVTGIVGSLRDNTGRKLSDEAHALQEKRIRSLYEISAEPGMGIETQLVETLKTGADMLSMEVAGVGRIAGKYCTVLYCYDEMGRVTQGLECELSKTYCKITLANDDVLAIDHVGGSEYRNEEFYRVFGFESYIGVPLRINGKVFGTLNFASPHPRKKPFTTADKDFIRLMGRWISTMIERKQAEDMLKEKEELYRTLVENAHDLILEILYDGRIMYASSNHKEILGYKQDELLGKNVFELMHPEDRSGVMSAFIQGFGRGSARRVVYRYRHKNGEWRWFEGTGKPFRTSTGEIRAIVDTRDINERKKTEEQIQESLMRKESLLREIHHRVKNNLQVISSLLSLQSDYAKDEESLALFYESQSRISTIALIHEKLYQSRNIDEIKMLDYITDLTRNLLRVYKDLGENVHVQINAYDISIDVDQAIPCGLIINELFSNCLKHAFHSRDSENLTRRTRNKVSVEINSDSDGVLTLSVRDNGVGFPDNVDFRNTNTLGLQLVCTLTDQLKGTIEIQNRNGTMFNIVFPIPMKKSGGN